MVMVIHRGGGYGYPQGTGGTGTVHMIRESGRPKALIV